MKKIMFNDRYGLTQAVLEGRKTMTRRIIKAPKKMDGEEVYGFAIVKKPGSNEVVEVMALNDEEGMINNILPIYRPGEDVAVAQAYKDALNPLDWVNNLIYKNEPGWTNKMFVGADLMPHRIFINAVRVERLQDISDEDCLREGILEDCPNVQYSFPTEIGYCGQYPFSTPREAFAALIDKVSGKGTWASNPWVFVYEFELVK